MAIEINDNLYNKSPKPLDSKYLDGITSFTSVANANAAIDIAYRSIGLKVNINNIDYWYKDGITDIDLVEYRPESTNSNYASTSGYADYAGYASTSGYADYAGYAAASGYADDAGYASTAGWSLNANPTNGLSRSGNNIKLGGTLSENTLIDGTYAIRLGTSTGTDNTYKLQVVGNTLIEGATGGAAYLYIKPSISHVLDDSIISVQQSGSRFSIKADGTNILIGSDNANTTTLGSSNISLGSTDFPNATSGAMYNTFIGSNSGASTLTTGDGNVSLGNAAGQFVTTGQYNTSLGYATSLVSGINFCSIAIGAFSQAPASRMMNIGNVLYADNLRNITSSSATPTTDGRIGIGTISISSRLTLPAGQATAGLSPLKFTSGTALTTPENGAMEYHNSHLYFTIGSTRYQLDQQSGGGGGGTSGLQYGTNGLISNGTSVKLGGELIENTNITSLNNSTLSFSFYGDYDGGASTSSHILTYTDSRYHDIITNNAGISYIESDGDSIVLSVKGINTSPTSSFGLNNTESWIQSSALNDIYGTSGNNFATVRTTSSSAFGNGLVQMYTDANGAIQIGNIPGNNIFIDFSGITITLDTPDTFRYAADYSANYTTRSLVDKEYVDNAVVGAGGFNGTAGWAENAAYAYDSAPDASKADKNPAIVSITSTTTLDATHDGKIIECDGTFTLTLPDGMVVGYTVAIVNIDSGVITLDATTTLITDSGDFDLAENAACSAFHSGSNIWRAFGKFTS